MVIADLGMSYNSSTTMQHVQVLRTPSHCILVHKNQRKKLGLCY